MPKALKNIVGIDALMDSLVGDENPAGPSPSPLEGARARMEELATQMRAAYPERDAVIDTLMTALVAGEHVLLLGPPGTAKSDLARTFARALHAPFFVALMTRYTTPDEIFGPFSLRALEQDRLQRKTAGRLPEAEVAFLDEVFKSSSAILNSLLTAINEREMDDDGGRKKLPLRLIVAASNELPEEDENLAAFDDRLAVRHLVTYIEDYGNFERLLTRALPPVTATLGMDDVDVIAAHAQTLPVSPDVVTAMRSMVDTLRGKGIPVSDRKVVKSMALLRAHAARRGDAMVTSVHLEILAHVFWRTPTDLPAVRECIAAHVAPWLRDIREAAAAIEEQATRLTEAMRASAPKRTIATMGDVSEKVKEVKSTVLDRLARDHPEAADDVARLSNRITAIGAMMKQAMASLGM